MQAIDSGTAFAIFGVENQSEVDRFMPVRCMQYDASLLAEQVKNAAGTEKMHEGANGGYEKRSRSSVR